ncbi:MAG: lasso peptide biosynthesis B2 protein [Vicinamibacterales bacterium]
MTAKLAPARGVLWRSVGDLTIVLSLADDRYYTLNELGGTIWTNLCTGLDVAQIAECAAAEYECSKARIAVRQDVEALVAELRQHRLLAPIEPDSVPHSDRGRDTSRPKAAHRARASFGAPDLYRPRAPSLLYCLIALAAIHLSLRLLKPLRVLSCLHGLARRSQELDPSPEWCAETVRTVTAAGALYPFTAQCFEQSLCFLFFARRAGADATLRIGVLPHPLTAHAWVEHRGKPLNDTLEHLQLYRAFPPFDPHAD